MRYIVSAFLSLMVIFEAGAGAAPPPQHPSKPDVVIYTIPGCVGCGLTKSMFEDRKIPYKEIDLTGKPSVYQEMKRKAGRKADELDAPMTVPQIFINGKHIGGYSDLCGSALDALVEKPSNQQG